MTQLAPPLPRQGEPSAPPPRRDAFFDNAKYLAILVVVIGHSIVGQRREVPAAEALYLFIYLFHMPLFITITGYFSRKFSFAGHNVRKLLVGVVAPYVIFEVLYELQEWHTTGELEFTLLRPNYLTWFLVALFIWRVTTPIWQQIRFPLTVSVVIAVLSFMSPLSGVLALHKVLGFLPFYVLGLVLTREHLEHLKKTWVRIAGGVVLVGGLAACFVVKDRMNYLWIFWRDTNEDLGVSELTGSAMRLAMIAVGAVLTFAFLAVVPRRRTFFTALGATTIYTFLLHGFVVQWVQHYKWDRLDALQNIPGLLLVIVLAVIVGTLLSTQPVVKALRWAVEPKLNWAFRQK